MGCTLNLQLEARETDTMRAHKKGKGNTFDLLSPHFDEEKASIKVPTNISVRSKRTETPKSIFQFRFSAKNLLKLQQNDSSLPPWAIQAVDDLNNEEHSNDNKDPTDYTIDSSSDSLMNNIFANAEKFKSEHDMIAHVVGSQHANEIEEEDVHIEKEIGHGHFGAAYKAKWEGNSVVVKHLNNSSWKEMIAEIVLASSLRTHPNLVTIYGYIRKPFGAVMLYMPGDSVEKYVYRKYKSESDSIPTIIELLIILRKAANGLKFLHQNGLVHRDIASRNILLGKIVNGVESCTEVKISDFGLMRVARENNGSDKTESNCGPVRWMAPESIQQKEYSKKSDVYMFGMAMYEIFYGIEPYENIDIINVAMKVVYQKYRPQIFNNNPKYRHCKMPLGYLKLMQLCWHQSPMERLSFKEIVNSFEKMEGNLLLLK